MTAPAVKVLAIDPSLTKTATCWTSPGTQPALSVSRTKPTMQTATAKLDRMRQQCAFAGEHAAEADLIVVEAPSMASAGRATRDLAGLWWLMFAELTASGRPVGVVPPSVLKKWITGVGNADKFRVGQHAAKRWPDVELRTDDEADALVLAGIGLHRLGVLAWTPTTYQVEALTKIEWNGPPLPLVGAA